MPLGLPKAVHGGSLLTAGLPEVDLVLKRFGRCLQARPCPLGDRLSLPQLSLCLPEWILVDAGRAPTRSRRRCHSGLPSPATGGTLSIGMVIVTTVANRLIGGAVPYLSIPGWTVGGGGNRYRPN